MKKSQKRKPKINEFLLYKQVFSFLKESEKEGKEEVEINEIEKTAIPIKKAPANREKIYYTIAQKEIIFSPASIGKELGTNRDIVGNFIVRLRKNGFCKRIERGKYRKEKDFPEYKEFLQRDRERRKGLLS